jgi:hypothetical protein
VGVALMARYGEWRVVGYIKKAIDYTKSYIDKYVRYLLHSYVVYLKQLKNKPVAMQMQHATEIRVWYSKACVHALPKFCTKPVGQVMCFQLSSSSSTWQTKSARTKI